MQVGRPAQQLIPSHHHKTQNYGSSYSNGRGAKMMATHTPSPSLTTIRTVEAGNFSENLVVNENFPPPQRCCLIINIAFSTFCKLSYYFLGRHSLMAGLMILIQFFGEKAISPIF